jgi:hypothetical protein
LVGVLSVVLARADGSADKMASGAKIAFPAASHFVDDPFRDRRIEPLRFDDGCEGDLHHLLRAEITLAPV